METEPESALRWRPAMAWLAPLTALVMPVRTARRLDHVGMLRAWLVHLLGVAVVFFAMCAIEALHSMSFRESFLRYPGKLWHVIVSFAMEFTYNSPEEAWFALVVYALTLEAGVILLAWFLMPWGARDETYNQSLRRAMVRIWLISSFVAAPIVVIGVLARLIDWLDYVIGNNLGPISWVLRHEALLHAPTWLIVISTSIALVLWAMSAGKWRARCRWPAACEGCGYSLMGMRLGQTCPECGLAVEHTLSEHRRPGSPLETTRGVSFSSLLRCMVLPIVRPRTFGKNLRLMTPTTAHRWFLLCSMLLSLALAAFGTLAVMWVFMVYDGYFNSFEDFFTDVLVGIMAAWITYLCAAPLIVLGSAALVASSARVFLKRNVMTVTMQGSCYLSGLLIIWTALIFLWLAGIRITIDWLENTLYVGNYGLLMSLIPLSFLVINLFMLLIYLFPLGRITWAAAHANW